jgi:hypothetical protein
MIYAMPLMTTAHIRLFFRAKPVTEQAPKMGCPLNSRAPRSAGFQACCIADFPIG